MTRQIVLDTETTGLDAKTGDRIIEIGCVELDGRRIVERKFHCYLNPEREVSVDAFKVHGISNEFLEDKPLFADIADAFLEFVQGSEIIIHNAPFDVSFLDAELARLDRPGLSTYVYKVTDSLLMARRQFPGTRNSLDALCKRFGVDNSYRDFHGALLDASLLAQVFLAMTRGQENLFEESTTSTPRVHQATDKQWQLPVLLATETELLEHENVLRQIDKESKQKTVWDKAERPVNVAVEAAK